MGDYAEQLVKNCAIVQAIPPADHNGLGARSGTPISLKGWDHCTIVIETGATNVATPAVTLTQDTSVTPTANVKALAFTHYYTNNAVPGSNAMVDTACASTFNMTVVDNVTYVIEIDADSLDADNNFDCLRVEVATCGANIWCFSADYILLKGRYTGATATIKDATID